MGRWQNAMMLVKDMSKVVKVQRLKMGTPNADGRARMPDPSQPVKQGRNAMPMIFMPGGRRNKDSGAGYRVESAVRRELKKKVNIRER